MIRLFTTLRVPLLFVLGFVATALTLLFSAGIVVPGAVGSSVWIALAVGVWMCFRAHKVALISLSRAAISLYLYPSVALLWPILYPQITIAVRSKSFQTAEIFAKANHLVAIGLAAMLAGWLLAFELRARGPRTHCAPERPPVSVDGFMPLMLMALPFLVLAFPTESIFTVGYTGAPRETTLGAAVEINVLKPALYICLLLALLSLLQRPTPLRKVFWASLLAVAILVLGFASGNRVEELGCLLGVGWVFQNCQPSRRFPKRGIAIAIVLALVMLVLGEIRNALPFQPLDSGLLVDATRRAFQIFPRSDTFKMKPSTNGDIATTLCVVIGLIDTGVLEVDHGETFVKYISMTLPRFFNRDRPIELQVFLQQLAMTEGGLFILAEPYMAGGAVGVLIIMGLFGFLIGALEIRSVRRELTPITFFLYLMLLSCVPRWFLYSILSMYKHVLTGTLILLAAQFASGVIGKRLPRHLPAALPS
jgi:hypothetical protein